MALTSLSPHVHAGQYVARTTSGLTASSPQSYGVNGPSYGAGSCSVSGGGNNGTCTVGGTLSTTFDWVRDKDSDGNDLSSDDPPAQVIVTEACDISMSAQAYPAASPSGTASNGLDARFSTTTTTTDQPIYYPTPAPPYRTQIGNGAGGHSYGTAPRVAQGGETVTVTCSPTGSCSADHGSLSLSLSYSVSIAPVTISIGGTKSVGGVLKSLIGIHQTATMSGGGCALRDFNWNVSGPQIFGSVAMASDQSSRHYDTALVYPHALTNSTKYDEGDEADFYASRDGGEEASCTAEAYAIGVSGSPVDLGSVNAIKRVSVVAPSSTLTVALTPGSASTFLPDRVNPSDLSSSSSSSDTSDPALEFHYSVQAEPDFAEYTPQVNLCQLAGEDDTFTPAGRFGWVGWWLDSQFPYFSDQPADGTPYTNANDSPSQPVTSTWTAISIRETHLLSTLYIPSGGAYVPLKSLEWLWSATSSHGTDGWSIPTGGIGPTGTTYPEFDLDAVQWDHKAPNGQSYPYPHN